MLLENVFAMVLALGMQDAECLAKNAYFEARNQSDAGMIAVTHVVLNRVASDQYPDTVCEVVQQGPVSEWHLSQGRTVPLRNRCQFSWYCDGLSDTPKEHEAWQHAVRVSNQAFELYLMEHDITDGSMWYHAQNVSPVWRHNLNYVMKIDDHLFYSPLR